MASTSRCAGPGLYGPAAGSREPFRSDGEAQIGRCLDRYGIPYRHEHPLAVLDDGKLRVWYPDFQLDHYGMLIEYGGRLDDPHYRNGWEHKQRAYEANGIDALMLTPRDLTGDWPSRLLERIEGTLEDRVRRFASCIGEGGG